MTGFLQPTDINNISATYKEFFVDGFSAENPVRQRTGKSHDIRFYFEGFQMQKCFGLILERASLVIRSDPLILGRNIPAGGELCGDVVNDSLALNACYLSFGSETAAEEIAGVIRLREMGGAGRTLRLELFHSEDNDYYTFEEFVDLLLIRLKDKVEHFYGRGAAQLDVSFGVTPRGRFLLAWKPNDHIKNVMGGGFRTLEIDINVYTSPLWGLMKRWVHIVKLRRGDVVQDTVIDGDGIEFLISRTAETDRAFDAGTGLVVLLSDELTKYQKSDSITPVNASGEIGVASFSSGYIGVDKHGTELIFDASTWNNTLIAPKIDFDPESTLSAFSVIISSGIGNSLFDQLIDQAGIKLQAGGYANNADQVRAALNAMVLTLTMRLY